MAEVAALGSRQADIDWASPSFVKGRCEPTLQLNSSILGSENIVLWQIGFLYIANLLRKCYCCVSLLL